MKEDLYEGVWALYKVQIFCRERAYGEDLLGRMSKKSLKFISELHFGLLIKRTGCTRRTIIGLRSKVGKNVQP